MNAAFLFNSDHSSLGSVYGPPVMERILGAGVLQSAERHMRVSIGDILTYGAAANSKTPTIAYLEELCRAVYRPKVFDRIIKDRLEATHGKATVFCWLFQNITAPIAEVLHTKLILDPFYLGSMDIDFSEPLQLRFFRNSLPDRYRLRGQCCSMFYSMSDNEDPDLAIHEIFERHGFEVCYEDIGARQTIFDQYDTLSHFKRVEDFKRVFSNFDGLNDELASDLTINLEELHPKLFDAFSAAARTLERAETAEDLAQAALSGRRLLERVADYLFPPRAEAWNGRRVGPNEYKNRLWAYVEKTMTEAQIDDPAVLRRLGAEADRLISLFNAGLHATPTQEKVEAAFRDLIVWLSEVVELDPAAIRRPYLAYEEELSDFFQDVLRDNADS